MTIRKQKSGMQKLLPDELYICVRVYMYTCVHIYIHMCTCTYKYENTHTNMYVLYTHKYLNIQVNDIYKINKKCLMD